MSKKAPGDIQETLEMHLLHEKEQADARHEDKLSQSPKLEVKTNTVPEAGPSQLPNEEVQTNPPEDKSFELRNRSSQFRQVCDELLKHLLDIQKTGKPDAEFIKQTNVKLMTHLFKLSSEQMDKMLSKYTVLEMLLSRPHKNKPDEIWQEIGCKLAISLHALVEEVETDAQKIGKHCFKIRIQINELIDATEIETEEGDCAESDTGTNYKDKERRRIFNLFKKEPEEAVLRVLQDCIDTETKLYRDPYGYTMLHKAVQKNYLSVAELLMDSGVNPLDYAMGRILPLHIAIHKGFDELAALVVSKVPKSVIRRMFGEHEPFYTTMETPNDNGTKDIELSGTYDKYTVKQMFTMETLILEGLDKTLLQVLNTFEDFGVTYFTLLDADDKWLEPDKYGYNRNKQTTFQALVHHEKKDAINHPVIKKYVEYHWKTWCRKRYLYYGLMYVVSLFCLTFSVATGVIVPDVCTYDDTPIQYLRAVMEVISYLYAFVVLINEIRQIKRYKCSYFNKVFNFLDLFSAILIIMVLPLRYIHLTAHWYVYALGYLLWAVRIFKYAIVFSQSGVYVEVIKRTILWDIIPFSCLFIIINTIFSGTFLLVLKADDSLYTHNDTSSFQDILYVGVRTLIEAGPIVVYAGSDGYRMAGTIVMLVYMFFTIVVMLNILIAQLSGTYERTHDESIKTDYANRALLIARAQRKDRILLFIPWSWTKHFKNDIYPDDKFTIDNSIPEDLSTPNDIMRKKQIKIGLDVHILNEKLKSFEAKVEKNFNKLTSHLADVQTVEKRLQSFEAKVEENMDKFTGNLETIEQLLLKGHVDKHV